MPFVNKEKKVIFIPPSSEDIVNNRKEILEIEETAVQKELTKELQEKIAEHARYLVSSSKGVLPFQNRNVYSIIRSLVSERPKSVDIIIPIYNSIHIARQCIEKVLKRTAWPYHIYIVDDASDNYTKEVLKEFEKNSNITVITNKKNKGFAATVNRGIRAGTGNYICLLNSDVLVTDLWLTKMVLAARADERNQIVCPATNNTAVVDIPLSQGANYITSNSVFEKFAVRVYPEIMPTGFCFLFRRELTEKIGLFPEIFRDFGEESSVWWKTVSYQEKGEYQGYRAVMADDSYVFHQRGESYSSLGSETHLGYRKLAASKFNSLHPEWVNWRNSYNVKKALGHLRDKIPSSIINDNKTRYRICWVVHATNRCGGMQYIADIVNELVERGIDAKVALIKRNAETKTDYIGELRTAPVVFEDYADFVNNFNLRVFRSGIVCASTVELSSVVRSLCDNFPRLKPVLHCQSYEPDLVEDSSLKTKIKQCFHLIPDIITNSSWITDTLQKEYGIHPFAKVNPGVNIDLFYPRDRELGDDRLTIMIPVAGENLPYRGMSRVKKLVPTLEKKAREKNIDIRIMLVGIDKFPVSPTSAICLGQVPPVRLATLLGIEVDLFVEPSFNHSYGMPALEAMATGIPVISWDNKGIHEYATKDNSIIFSKNVSIYSAADTILQTLLDEDLREKLGQEALKVRETHNRNKLVGEFIEKVENKFSVNFKPRKITIFTPHLRKHGGPTTLLNIANELAARGHSVGITTLYSDVNPELTRMSDVPINMDPNNISNCDVAIINSDNPMCPIISKSRNISKKIMLKLSHNERFKQLEEQGLNQKWDAIITSSGWLKEICEKPNWNYPPQKATRVGWWHYSHEIMAKDPEERTYGDGINTPIIIGTLIHNHPLKGSKEAMGVLGQLSGKYGKNLRFVGIGEVPKDKFSTSLPNFQYIYSPNREQLASIFQKIDIWFGMSKTEGLGRMALEAMSAGCAVSISDTSPEYAENGINCLLHKNEEEAFSNLDKIIETPELRKTLSTQGYRTAREAANSESCIEEIEKVIEGLF